MEEVYIEYETPHFLRYFRVWVENKAPPLFTRFQSMGWKKYTSNMKPPTFYEISEYGMEEVYIEYETPHFLRDFMAWVVVVDGEK